jgi:hypothetical protein
MSNRKIEQMLYAIGVVIAVGTAAFLIVGAIFTRRLTGINTLTGQYVELAALFLFAVVFSFGVWASRYKERIERKKAAAIADPKR